MDLNQLVFNRLSSDEELEKKLAKFCGKPAVFNTEFPSDQDPGWGGQRQYPRISYQFNMQVDAERSSTGTFVADVYSDNLIEIDYIESCIRRSLKDVLMKPDGEAPFCVAWQRTDPYFFEGNVVACKEITFDILEYPSQETTDPDPIEALSVYIKALYPDSTVLGLDGLKQYTNPAETPVFYCRLENSELDPNGHCQNTITWFTCNISVHLLCPDASIRLKMIAGLNQLLANQGEVIMLDDSPMTIRGLRINNRADYLRMGQLSVTGYYGCLKGTELKRKVTNIFLNQKN